MSLAQIQQDVSRYADINHIFETANKRGYVHKLSKFLEDVFSSEIQFAQSRLKEVIQVMQKQGQKIEYSVQLARNIQIFKSNFDLILTATSNAIWSKVVSQLDQDEECQPRIETIPSAFRKSDMNRYSEPDIKKLASSRSFNSRSPSRYNSSMSAVKTVPMSELSYVSGGSPSSFSRAKRKLDNSLSTCSPGVGKYQVESAEKHVRQTSPSATIGRAPKISWIDEKTQKPDQQTPGPIYNPVKTFLSKKLKQ